MLDFLTIDLCLNVFQVSSIEALTQKRIIKIMFFVCLVSGKNGVKQSFYFKN